MRKSYTARLISSLAIVVSLVVCMFACHKTKPENTDYANDDATAEQTFDNVDVIVDQAATLPSGSSLGYKTAGSGCATVTHSGDSIIVNFGPADCLCHDNRKRRGEIIVTCTGVYNEVGSVHTIIFDDYYDNDNKVTGTKTVTYMGLNAQQQPYYDIRTNGSVTLNSTGGTVSATWTKTRTWTTGYSTPGVLTDDVYQVTGSGTLTRANGQQVATNITVPLVVAYSCPWIEAGSVTFTIASGQFRTLNYGNTPACDDIATITLGNGTVRTVTLP